MKKNNKGFGTLEVLIVLLAATVIGAAVYVFVSRSNNSTEQSQSTSTSLVDQKTENTDQSTNTSEQKADTVSYVSEALANKVFDDPQKFVDEYCTENKLTCKTKLLYEDGTYSKIYDTGVDRGGTEKGTDYLVVVNEGKGWQYNFFASGGCETGTDHPGLVKYCATIKKI